MKENIRQVMEKYEEAERDERRKRERKKPDHSYTWFRQLGDVNEPLECIMMLKELNDTIDLLYKLWDANYYLDFIWNSGASQDKELKENGFTEEYFQEVTAKFEMLRTILFGHALDWERLYEQMYDSLLEYEVYYRKFEEENAKRLRNENSRLQKQIKKEGVE